MNLLIFPANRRTADVKSCAERLQALHGEAANEFWRAEMARFAAEMKAQGAEIEEIRRQATAFLLAVQTELEMAYRQEA